MRRLCIHAMIVALPALQGCYTYLPLQATPPAAGESVQLQISDRGRVELSERLGHGVSRIEGRITGVNGDQYAINVSSIAYVSGENSLWSGESVRLSRDFVQQVQVRTLDKQRTWIAAGVTTVAVVGFIASRGLLVDFFGGGSEEPSGGEPPASFRLKFGFPF
jgi:hypothetical protein